MTRRATMRPMGRPAGSPSSVIEPFLSAGTIEGSSSFTRVISTSPSMTSANSSWAAVRHPESPSARSTSITYSMFLATATFS
jgi:hypothetical protein